MNATKKNCTTCKYTRRRSTTQPCKYCIEHGYGMFPSYERDPKIVEILFYSRGTEYGWLSNFERAYQLVRGLNYPTNILLLFNFFFF